MMRILCVTPFYKPAYGYGGPARSIPYLCEALAELGCSVEVFTTDANGSGRLDVEPGAAKCIDGVTVRYFHRKGLPNYFYAPNLAGSCYSSVSRFDIVYIYSTWGFPFLPAAYACHRLQVPYVISPRTSFMHRTWRLRDAKKSLYHLLFERRLINSCAALHYTTELEKNDSAWTRLRPRSFVVPNPVDLREFATLPARGSFRSKYEISDDAQVILFLGRKEPRKGLPLAVSAFAKLALNNQYAILILAGPSEDGHDLELRRLAESYGVERRIIFTGYLDTASRLEALVDSDVFLLTSLSENFGMAVVEAMAAGLPVVVSEKVGIADIIRRTGAGITVPLDPATIAMEVEQLLRTPEKRQAIGIRARRTCQENFSPQSVAKLMLAQFTMATGT